MLLRLRREVARVMQLALDIARPLWRVISDKAPFAARFADPTRGFSGLRDMAPKPRENRTMLRIVRGR